MNQRELLKKIRGAPLGSPRLTELVHVYLDQLSPLENDIRDQGKAYGLNDDAIAEIYGQVKIQQQRLFLSCHTSPEPLLLDLIGLRYADVLLARRAATVTDDPILANMAVKRAEQATTQLEKLILKIHAMDFAREKIDLAESHHAERSLTSGGI